MSFYEYIDLFYVGYVGLLACSAWAQSMWYMPMHIAAHVSYVVACIIFLCMKIFVCFIKKLACLQ
jgi:dolichyl-phosphate-mannose--protein O-mannosyl transferase